MKKKIIFSAIGILIPFIVLIIIEIFLRLVNVESTEKIFVTDERDPSYYIVNPNIGQRFLDNPGIKPPLSFISKKKLANEVRIIVMGASTTVGFPYGHEIAFPKILQKKLQCRFPSKKISVINIGLTSINTYTVLEMTDEAIKIEPDFVLLYSGQNEFYGRYGVGSSQSGGLSPFVVRLYLYLKKFRITKLIKKALRPGIKESEKSTTLMAKMVGNKAIELHSKPYNNALIQYSYNLDEIINKFRKKNIPLFIGTLVSNQKDLPPFNSKALHASQKQAFQKANQLFAKKKFEDSLEKYLRILAKDSTSANLNYQIGKNYYLLNNYTAAKTYFNNASQLDLIRFRAPQEFNQIIEAKNKFSNVIIVDINKEFKSNSPNAIIGNELLLEHVHPTINGYKLMAKAYYNSIIKSRLFPEPATNFDCDNYYISKVDSIYGFLLITRLKQNWPFTKTTDVFNEINFVPKNEFDKIAYSRYLGKISWPEANNKLYNYYLKENNFTKAYETASILSDEYPVLDTPVLLMVNSLLKSKNYAKADSLLSQSIKLVESDKLNKEYFHVLLLEEDIDKSISFLRDSYFNSDKDILLKNLRELQMAKHNYDSLQSSHKNALALAEKYATFGLIENVTKYKIIADSLFALYE